MYAQVIVEYPVKTLDKTFTYSIPSILKNVLLVGMKVKVPFGTKEIEGFVLEITDICEADYEIREIIEIIDKELILNEELLHIADFLKEETLCTKIKALQSMLPSSLKAGNKKRKDYAHYEAYIRLNKEVDIESYIRQNRRYEKQIEIIELLENEERISKKDINNSSLKTLLSRGIVVEEKEQVYRLQNKEDQIKDKVLTEEQQNAFLKIKESLNEYKTFLLFGVTGSGKTEVYIKIIKEVIASGKRALVMVPEISLTTQIAQRFAASFGSDVAILHSSLSVGEKYDEYIKIIRKEVHVVVGTRSSVFAPLENLGIIIIDEEDSPSYKQENTPKYHAKDVAMYRAKYNHIPLVLATATPTLEAKARADKGVFELIKMEKRVGASTLPEIHIVDMEKEMKQKNMIFSRLLIEKIKEKLEKKEQVILLLNRRGFSTFITCSNCGFVYKCPSCDITMTFHKTSNNVMCHYCGYTIKKSDLCPKCHEDALNYYGLGTEKLESELQKIFNEARIIRMDQDVTQKKGAHERIIKAFKNLEYDILVGTQMVSKGLDFPKVSLVGVINADASLNIPDFRSNETTFSLLSQVAGRAGRSDIKGEVIIQTFNPDNYIIQCVKNNDYNSFYRKEMDFRRKLRYPPYYYLVGIKVIGKSYEVALKEAQKVKKYLDMHLNRETICLGPTTAAVLKYKEEYRFQIIIKYRFDESLKSVLKEIASFYVTNKDCYIDIDFNPNRI